MTSMSSAGLVSLAGRSPGLFGRDLELPDMMFELLSSGENELRASAQEALSSLVEAYVVSATPDVLERLRTKLLVRSNEEDFRVRSCALTWLGRLYPFEDPAVRYVCMELSSDPRQEVRRLATNGLILSTTTVAASSSSVDGGETKSRNNLLTSSDKVSQFRRGKPPSTSDMIRFLMR